jgi:hypothetical protein
MSVFKTTKDILLNPWNYNFADVNSDVEVPYAPVDWDHEKEISIDDVRVWEQLYYQPGNIGIYVSWDPYAEFYLITYNLFLNTPAAFETFFGAGSGLKVQEKLKKIGIELEENQIWVYPKDLWLHQAH